MKLKISGSSGYLGKIISKELIKNGHQPDGINRQLLYGPEEKLAAELKNTDAVIHLAGAPILKRWDDKNKKEILGSRVETAKNLSRAINLLETNHRPRKVISASGISIFSSGKLHTEKSIDFDSGFLGEVVKKWEEAWVELPPDVELTIFRTAVVLGKQSPTIKKMLFPFKMGVGGKIGNGKQPFPFVHEKDVARAYIWALENKQSKGTYILAAPSRIDNAGFTKALASSLNRPAFLTIPSFILKLIYGEASVMLTSSPEVHPGKLLKNGFNFEYSTVEHALNQIFN